MDSTWWLKSTAKIHIESKNLLFQKRPKIHNNDNNEDTRNFEINPSNVIPSENFSGSGIVQINLNNVAGPPLPRNLIRVRIGALELSNINLENNMVEGSFNGLSEGIYDVTATFRTPNGTIFNYTAEQSFSVFIVN